MTHRAMLALVSVLALANAASAGTLIDVNSVLTYNVDTNSVTGLGPWIVDGTNHLNAQWFWYRTGTMTREQSINTLGPPEIRSLDSDWDPGAERLLLRDTAGTFTITIDVILTGGASGSNWSDIAEVVTVQNTSGAPLEFHLYHFCNPVVNNTALNEVGQILGGNTAYVEESPGVGLETVVGPMPDQYAVGTAAALEGALEDSAITDLGQVPGPLGPNQNVAWAFQWDIDLEPEKTFIMSADKVLFTPEPASLALMGAGMTALVTVLRKRMHP